jgi:hypothetical protein
MKRYEATATALSTVLKSPLGRVRTAYSLWIDLSISTDLDV